jgi:diadenosine tetraphosphatase ApaH/serine/threonine PP2A family protein phosphatase
VTLVEITADKFTVEFLRVPYDVEKTAAAIVESGLPPYFAEKLREAR